MTSRHRHRFRVSSWCGKRVAFRCFCGEVREREMDREEKRQARAHVSWQPSKDDDVHRVWHDFLRRFQKDGIWKYAGYDLMKRAAK